MALTKLTSVGKSIARKLIDYLFGRVVQFKSLSDALSDEEAINGGVVQIVGGLREGVSFTYVTAGDTIDVDKPDGVAILQCTGVPSLALKMQERSVLIPEEYGAVGDGLTPEDTDVIEVILRRGKPIRCTGSYLITRRLITDRLRLSGGGEFILSSVDFGFMEVTGSNSLIEGMTFRGAGATGQVRLSTDVCFSFSNYEATGNVVRDCKFDAFTFYCIELKSKYSTISQCTFTNIGYWAIGSFNRFNYISKNKLINCGLSTSSYTGGGITVTYSAIDGDTMGTVKSTYNYITDNVISTSRQVAIDTHSGYKLTITGNIITDCDLDGIYLHRTSYVAEGLTDLDGRVTDCIVSGNTIDNCLSGITLSSFEEASLERTACIDNLIEGNTITNCVSSSINLARGSSKNTVQGNYITGSGRPIYLFYWCHSNIIKGNTIRADGTTGYLIDINAATIYTCRKNVIEGNILDLQGFSVTGIRSGLGAEGTLIKVNEFLNRGNTYPIIDSEQGTGRQAEVVHLPRAWSYALSSLSDMRGEVILNTLPSAGSYIGWTCITSGDQSTTNGVWKGYGLIEA